MPFQLFGPKEAMRYLETWLPGSLAGIRSNKCRSNKLERHSFAALPDEKDTAATGHGCIEGGALLSDQAWSRDFSLARVDRLCMLLPLRSRITSMQALTTPYAGKAKGPVH